MPATIAQTTIRSGSYACSPTELPGAMDARAPRHRPLARMSAVICISFGSAQHCTICQSRQRLKTRWIDRHLQSTRNAFTDQTREGFARPDQRIALPESMLWTVDSPDASPGPCRHSRLSLDIGRENCSRGTLLAITRNAAHHHRYRLPHHFHITAVSSQTA